MKLDQKKNTHVPAWHAMSVKEVISSFGTDANLGLSDERVHSMRGMYGLNQITKKKGTPSWRRFFLQFHQPLIYILLAAGTVALILGERVDSSVIFAVVLVNAVIGFIQETKALSALDALSKTMVTQSTVVRGGRGQRIESTELVPGDVVLLSSGDKVPADVRLCESRALQVNESALTGESLSVQKKSEVCPGETALADRSNMLYASTFVTYGQGRAVVIGTGDRTEVGRISEMISTADELATPLTKKIARFSHLLLYVILSIAAITFAAGTLRGQPAIDMFMAAVALAVSAIPEGLPAAVTITLAIGVSRMARRRVIIRKLPAVETLGSTMVICSDKTGTLTKNQMTVQEIWAGGRCYAVSGAGYNPEGRIEYGGAAVNVGSEPALRECLMAGLSCNDSRHLIKGECYEIEGDPTEGALLVSALKAGLRPDLTAKRIDSIPFESDYQYMATLHESGEKRVVYVKGAVEKILELCEGMLNAQGLPVAIDKKQVLEWTHNSAAQGLRVLAFAMSYKTSECACLSDDDVRSGLIFLGLQSMIDPPRQEAVAALRSCYAAGITVKMITGDHVLTAASIARQLGFRKSPHAPPLEDLLAVTGKELEGCTDTEFESIAVNASVFARVTPEQKLKLIRVLQAKGNIVAMTGDGVNDAPALKQANIGVAMGVGGTEVAKEAADMVLTDDNFASIKAAVEEGRCVYDNLKKFIVWTLPTNMGEALAVLAAVLAGIALPILPVQILWVNMTTAVCLGLMLAFEPKEPGIMNRPPRNPNKPIMTGGLMMRTLYVGLLLVTGVFGLFILELNAGSSIEQARTVATSMLVVGELFYLFNCRSLSLSALKIGFFSNPKLLAGAAVMLTLQMLFTYAPAFNHFFHSAPIAMTSWMRIFAAGFLVYAVVGTEKRLRVR